MEVILGKNSGFCSGVRNAIEGAEKALKSCSNLYCLGEIVHNEEVINDLKQKGLTIIDSIEDAKNKVLIRAHGVAKEVYDIAKSKNIEIIDFTCPFVARIHDIVTRYSNEGFYIFLLGVKNHPETIGTISFCGNNSYLIESLDDIPNAIDNLKKSGIKKLLIISQTTFSISLFENIVDTIKSKIDSNINYEIKNTICNSTSIRQKEALDISKKVDLMIVIGGKNSSNTKKLFDIALKNCKETLLVQTKADLNFEYIQKFSKIGIIAGASTPQKIIDDIVLFCKN